MSFVYSQSSIKAFESVHPQVWYDTWVDKKVKKQRKDYYSLGSSIDCLVFTPDDYFDKFVVYEGEIPTDNVDSVIDFYLENYSDTETLQGLFKAARDIGYRNSFKDNTLIEYLKPFVEITNLIKKNEKLVIHKEAYEKSIFLSESLLQDERFFKIHSNSIFQVKLEALVPSMKNVLYPCKGILDMLYINKDRKTLQVVDLKTDEDPFYFKINARKFGYGTQLSFYNELVLNSEDLRPYFEDGYTLDNAFNVVLGKNDGKVVFYEWLNSDLESLAVGNPFKKGWLSVIEDIEYHFEKNDFSKVREELENGFIRMRL